MTTNSNQSINKSLFLRTSNVFPDDDIEDLSFEMTKVFIDIANAINNRTISTFPTNKPAETGESWFLFQNKKQQTLRKVFTFTTTAAITHNVSVFIAAQFPRCFGVYGDATLNSYGLIYGSNVAIPGQISFYITSTQIIFLVGAGAPALTTGTIILEWLSQP